MPTWFITGCSRGIGLEFVRQLAANPTNIVFATYRNKSTTGALQQIQKSAKGAVHMISLDVSDRTSIELIEPEVKRLLTIYGGKLDYLINNAAITENDDRAFSFSPDGLEACLRTNVIGPAILSQILHPYIARSDRKLIANITSGLASFGCDYGATTSSYSVSKAALNMLAYKQAKENPDLIVLAVHPGWVKTDMGGPDADFEAHQVVSGMLKLLSTATSEHSAGFFEWTGRRELW